MLSAGDSDWLCNYQVNLLRDANEATSLHQELGPAEPYVDPFLRNNPTAYSDFLHLLCDRGMLEWTLAPKDTHTIGVFFAAKKDGKIRVIFDARVCNYSFKDPLSTRLPTASSLSQVETDGPVFVAAGDINAAFYRMGLPSFLRFLLPWSSWTVYRLWK
ncbi:unnamed protein product [Prorocentrum cordatum]|uniref:Uncharacterized protein n=1 Tax=Prorocentrum cordatum TaxID=2364126 RepID=A0ABN9UGA1_9DINO|nr:unnamed protein product [Polarella glacialis]